MLDNRIWCAAFCTAALSSCKETRAHGRYDHLCRLAEVEFFDPSGAAIVVSSTSNPLGENFEDEVPDRVSDGDNTTAWFDYAWSSSSSVLEFTFASPSMVGRCAALVSSARHTLA